MRSVVRFTLAMAGFTPSLKVEEVAGRVRLLISGLGCYGEGPTLQEAADELVRQLLVVAMVLRSGSMGSFCSYVRPDLDMLEFLYELGEIAAGDGDIRARVFGNTSGDQLIP